MFGLIKEKRLIELQKKYNDLSLRIQYAEEKEKQNLQLQLDISKLEKELIYLKSQIREQVEADLFFISARIQKKLLDGEPKIAVQNLALGQLAYQQQLQSMQQQPSSYFLRGLGLGIENLLRRL